MLRKLILAYVAIGLLVQFPNAMALTMKDAAGQETAGSAGESSKHAAIRGGGHQSATDEERPCHRSGDDSSAEAEQNPCELLCDCSPACSASCGSVSAAAVAFVIPTEPITLTGTYGATDNRSAPGFSAPIYHPPR